MLSTMQQVKRTEKVKEINVINKQISTMKLKVDRHYKGDKYTIGKLYIDDVYFCDTLEDVDRGLTQDMNLSVIQEKKVMHQTAIPSGVYETVMNVKSPTFSKKTQYEFCDGYLPRLLNVPGFEGVLIHIGNRIEDSSGCLLVGENKVKGQVINSTATFKRLYAKLKEASDNGEEITVEIK